MNVQELFVREVFPHVPLVFAHWAKRVESSDLREELLQESVCNAWAHWQALLRKNDSVPRHLIPGLVKWAVIHALSGRGIAHRPGAGEAASTDKRPDRCRPGRVIGAHALSLFDVPELFLWATGSDPSHHVEVKIDFQHWINQQSPLKQRVARMLAMGNGTAIVAQETGLSAARVSQIRRELKNSWEMHEAC